MRLIRSATFRFAALVFLLQLAGALLLLAAVHRLTSAELSQNARALAEELRDDLLATYRQGGTVALAQTIARRTAPEREPSSAILLAAPDGSFLAGNIAAWPPNVPISTPWAVIEIYRIGQSAPERLGVVATHLPGGERLLTGHAIDNALRFTTVMEGAMLSTLLLAIALAAIAALVAARLIEHRLIATVETARAVAAGKLEHRVPLDRSGDAFERLAIVVNAMLDRIAALMTELKVVTDGLAHDLRSPLTRQRAMLERALGRTQEEQARLALGGAIEESDRLLAMLNAALQISRAEAGLGRELFVATDIGRMLADLEEMYGPLAEERGFSIALATEPDLVAPVHRELLGQALANLIDNALKYGAGEISLSADRRGDAICIAVADRGRGIAEDQRAEALRRFGRLDAARRGEGAGLGLSLVAAVARLHGGTLSLEDNDPGLCARLTIRPEADASGPGARPASG
ncbi:sensor histidine kinase [Flavisphingomonas formosensis]|uniref:sensor histidine kinase n=1 Tax=Flavisphingomonas formosensis TaxID=861534 RepID=UPI0012FAE226|nr:HAMP domain-containing sensor histidine kinase [Sphingomonas formosensis]